MIEQLNSLNQGERRSAAMLFLYGFGNAASYVVARTVADSAFLSRVGPEQLPLVYLVSAVAVAFVSAAYGRIVVGASSRRSVFVTLILLAVSSAILPTLIHHSASWSLAIVYVLSQIRGSMGTIQYTVLLNRQFADRQPERVVGVIGLGSTLAGFSVGIAIGFIIESIELASVMYIAAVLDVLTLIPVVLLPAAMKPIPETGDGQHVRQPQLSVNSKGTFTRSELKYAITIAAMVGTSVIAATLVEFEWKVTAAAAFQRDEKALATFFGDFYAGVYLLTGLLQVFATAAVLKHRGILTGLFLFPCTLLATSIAAFFAQSQRALLVAVSMAKGSDVLKRSMNDPCVQLLYGPIRPGTRHQAITWVAGITKPIAEAIAALGLVAIMPRLPDAMIWTLVLAIIATWLALDVRVYRMFRRLSRSNELADRTRTDSEISS